MFPSPGQPRLNLSTPVSGTTTTTKKPTSRSSITKNSSTAPNNTAAVPVTDTSYIWLLFATLAQACPEGAITITGEIKEKVLEVILKREQDQQSLAGLNMFLGVMGLNDDMVLNA